MSQVIGVILLLRSPSGQIRVNVDRDVSGWGLVGRDWGLGSGAWFSYVANNNRPMMKSFVLCNDSSVKSLLSPKAPKLSGAFWLVNTLMCQEGD